MKKKYANFLLEKTIADYNSIAAPFSMTRSYLSDDLKELKKYTRDGDRVLDLGCGNGRLSKIFDELNVNYLGLDDSEELIQLAKERHPKRNFAVTKPLKFDLPDNSIDVCYCLAVFHHIPSTELRLQYLREIRRVLVPDGIIVLSVWNMWRRPGMFWKILRDGILNLNLDLNDTFLPFKNSQGKVLANRYIHCFKQQELEKLFLESHLGIMELEYQRRGRKAENENILIVGRK
ncbi:MAG: class I SAM-dependent methyltransferase [Candidatus Berkelbacteria bacterium]|nr:class I SAM-dependent methyltransferase [Candidatus Berkelbacteria bacterium]